MFLFLRTKDPKYAHLTDQDLITIEQAYSQAYQWLEQTRGKCLNASKHLPPPVTVAQIRQEKSNFESAINIVLNKPPPKAPSPPKDEKPAGDQKSTEGQNQQQNGEKSEENMEWSATN